jgi:hypothetical protein
MIVKTKVIKNTKNSQKIREIQLFFCWECEEELWQEKMERILIIFLIQVFKCWKRHFLKPMLSWWGYYIEVLHVIYQKKLENILYKLKLTLALLFLREKCITPLKRGGRTVTRKNGKNSDHFPKPMLSHT